MPSGCSARPKIPIVGPIVPGHRGYGRTSFFFEIPSMYSELDKKGRQHLPFWSNPESSPDSFLERLQ